MRELLTPPNRLAEDAVKGSGPSLEAILEAVDAGIATLQQDYESELLAELTRLGEMFEGLSQAESAQRGETIDALYQVAHDMRGLAGSFGYPLLTQVANSLCRVIDDREKREELPDDVVACHVGAMRAIAAGKVKGDGGRQGRDLIRSLEALIAKSSSEARDASQPAG